MKHSPPTRSHAMAQDHPGDIQEPASPRLWFLKGLFCSQVAGKTRHNIPLVHHLQFKSDQHVLLADLPQRFIIKLDNDENGSKTFWIFFLKGDDIKTYSNVST